MVNGHVVATAGLTTIGLGDYTLATWAGMLPATFAYVYVFFQLCKLSVPESGSLALMLCDAGW